MNLDQELTDNFTLREFTKSQTAARATPPIDNTPDQEEVENLRRLCVNVLQPTRDVLGRLRINSGFRCLELNRAVGSKDTSDHRNGFAADIECPGKSNFTLAQWLSSEIDDFNQIILECYTPGDPNSGWVHVSFKPSGNKNEVLTWDGKIYKVGLIK
jgi:zinc D-Ala-D-Ala carboxypeptidase